MTDPTIITGKYGTLTVRTTTADDRISLLITNPSHGSVLGLTVPTAALLAAIDAHDPDAMRAYLRETAPEVIADLYRPEIPEADSPEDVDEHAVIELSDDIDTRLHVIERLAKILRAGTDAVEVCTLADWVIDR